MIFVESDEQEERAEKYDDDVVDKVSLDDASFVSILMGDMGPYVLDKKTSSCSFLVSQYLIVFNPREVVGVNKSDVMPLADNRRLLIRWHGFASSSLRRSDVALVVSLLLICDQRFLLKLLLRDDEEDAIGSS